MGLYEYWKKIIEESTYEELQEMRKNWRQPNNMFLNPNSPAARDIRINLFYLQQLLKLEKIKNNSSV